MPSLNQLLARVADIFAPAGKGIPLSNRNLFIDGAFDQWTGVNGNLSTGGAYTVSPMWLASAGAGGVATFGQTTMLPLAGVYPSDSNPKFAFVHTQTTASTGTVAAGTAPFTAYQRIEGAQAVAGRSVTFSIKLWTSSGSITIPNVFGGQYFGSGGSPSANVAFSKNVNWVVTTTPTRFSVRLDVPNTSGKTFGTNNNDFTNFGIWLPPGATFTLVGIEAQLEFSNPNSSSDVNGNGGAPTAFEYRGFSAELLRVQRHYYSSYWDLQFPGAAGVNPSFASSSIGANTYSNICHATYPAAMRTNPSVSMYSPNSGASGKYYSNNTTTDLAATVLAGTSRTCSVGAAGNAPSVGQGMQVCIVADARL